MISPLVATMIAVSVAVVAAVARWRRGRLLIAVEHAVAIAVASVLALVAPAVEAREILLAAAAAAVLRFGRQGRLTVAACVVTIAVTGTVALSFPPLWVAALMFLLGWAHFAGDLSLDARNDRTGSPVRDVIDLMPLIVAVTVAIPLLKSAPTVACVLVFSAVGFIVNDVLASEVGPGLPGRTWLPPTRSRSVPPGTPGAVSDGGTLLGFGASSCAGVCAAALRYDIMAGLCVAVAGISGGIVDSVLGRTDLRTFRPRGRELVNSLACAAAITIGQLLYFYV